MEVQNVLWRNVEGLQRENSIGPYNNRPRGGNLMLKYSLELRWSFSNEPTVYGYIRRYGKCLV